MPKKKPGLPEGWELDTPADLLDHADEQPLEVDTIVLVNTLVGRDPATLTDDRRFTVALENSLERWIDRYQEHRRPLLEEVEGACPLMLHRVLVNERPRECDQAVGCSGPEWRISFAEFTLSDGKPVTTLNSFCLCEAHFEPHHAELPVVVADGP